MEKLFKSNSFIIYLLLHILIAFVTMIFMDWWYKIFIDIQTSYSVIFQLAYLFGFIIYSILVIPKAAKFANRFNTIRKQGRTIAIIMIIICEAIYAYHNYTYTQKLVTYSYSFFQCWIFTFCIVSYMLLLGIYAAEGTIVKPNLEWERKFGEGLDNEVTTQDEKEIIRKEQAQKVIAEFFQKHPERYKDAVEEFENNKEYYLERRNRPK